MVGGVVVVVVVVVLDDEVGSVGVQDVGGLLCGVVVTVGWAGGVWVTAGGWPGSSGLAICLRSAFGFAASADDDADVDTVTITVDVLPSGATLVDVSTTTSAFGWGFACSSLVASIDARVANIVATTTPPADSRTTVDTFFFDGEGDSG